eukprot:4216080-Pyramimonas_sp.AAC.1
MRAERAESTRANSATHERGLGINIIWNIPAHEVQRWDIALVGCCRSLSAPERPCSRLARWLQHAFGDAEGKNS